MSKLIAKIIIDLDEYNQLKLAASKLAESEKIIKENLKIKHEHNHTSEEEPILNHHSTNNSSQNISTKQVNFNKFLIFIRIISLYSHADFGKLIIPNPLRKRLYQNILCI